MLLSLPRLNPIDRLVAQYARPGGWKRGSTVTGAALLGHLAVLAALISLSIPQPPSPAAQEGVALVMLAPAAATRPASPAVAAPVASAQIAPTPAPRATEAAAQRTVLHHASAAAARARAAASAPPARQAAALPAPAAQAGGVAAPRAPAAAPAAPDTAPLLAGLAAQIDHAVRSAAVMPEAARRQHREGRTQVRFTYRDGSIIEVALAQSSQSRLLDEAALHAVRAAAYPAPPALLRGRAMPMLLWIEFRMQGDAQG